MDLNELLSWDRPVLMEGALGERLKTEYRLTPDPNVALARFVYQVRGMEALSKLWNEYYQIAADHNLPFLATTPTRRAGRDFVRASEWDSGIIADNVRLLKRCLPEKPGAPRFLGGLMGCRGDAYTGAVWSVQPSNGSKAKATDTTKGNDASAKGKADTTKKGNNADDEDATYGDEDGEGTEAQQQDTYYDDADVDVNIEA